MRPLVICRILQAVMPPPNRISEMVPEIRAWRRDFHAHPELGYDVHRTAERVADLLRSFGCDDVVTGIGRTGIVALINGRRGTGPTLGLRADMDALPIVEETGVPYASRHHGLMHACGHDGHTAMLLGAGRYLAETRNFSGRVALVFQPAEEGGAGGKAMLDDGLISRFGIDAIYGMHNMPGLPVGRFALRPGPMMASTDSITITVTGQGGHAAAPHLTVDPVLAACHIVTQAQAIVARNIDPNDSAVVSITTFHAGEANNVISSRAVLTGTVRTFREDVRQAIEQRLAVLCDSVARAHGASATLDYARGYPVLVNHAAETMHAARVASDVVGAANVSCDTQPIMAAEDFAYMLDARPGAFIFLGNGDSAGLHNPHYDFNDDALGHGVAYWVALAEANDAVTTPPR